VPDTYSTSPFRGGKKDDASIGEVVDFVKAYAKQETLDPLKGAGRRLVQTEADRLARGSLSWAAYAVTLVVTIVLLAFTLLRVKKSTLNNEPK
jgi:hypothetical protein